MSVHINKNNDVVIHLSKKEDCNECESFKVVNKSGECQVCYERMYPESKLTGNEEYKWKAV